MAQENGVTQEKSTTVRATRSLARRAKVLAAQKDKTVQEIVDHGLKMALRDIGEAA